MIIPSIGFNSRLNPDELVDQVTRWSLLGQVALTDVTPADGEILEYLIKRVGGSVDILIEFSEPDQSQILAALNAGATRILSAQPEPNCESIPPERFLMIRNDDAPDQAVAPGCVLNLPHPTSDRIAELEMARVDCVVGVEHLTSKLIADFFQAVLVTDRSDGLWPTVIVDPLGVALGLAYSSYESLIHAIETRCGTYWSRSRDGLWIKGQSSGATQQLLGIRLDCDRDSLRFSVTQDPPGFCHRNTYTCFGSERTIQSVIERISSRLSDSDENSFTRKLAADPQMLKSKLLEESGELAESNQSGDPHEIAWEAADVLYFSLVSMLNHGVSLDRVFHELTRRMNRVVRRDPGIRPTD